MSESPAFYNQGVIMGMLTFKYGGYSALMGEDESITDVMRIISKKLPAKVQMQQGKL